MRLAAKVLSAVEVSGTASHQHEFNAGALRTALALPKTRTTGQLELTYLPREREDPQGETCSYTLYDSREGKPRSAEYRLYFDSSDLQGIARAGDVLIIVRADEGIDLRALIVPGGSETGGAMARTLDAEGMEISDKFQEIVTVVRASDLAEILRAAGDKTTVPDAREFLNAVNEEFIRRVFDDGKLPSSRAMASEAARVVKALRPGTLGPDQQLEWSLEAETALFQHLEERLGQRALDELSAAGRITFADATVLVMRQLQSRRSRRGQSLQNHFAAVMEARRIPYGAQCRTEGKETPDFMIPGCREYGDPAFPAVSLRMVACKSTLKERWRQILAEAERIPQKYVLTLDTALTDDGIAQMTAARLSLFLPAGIIGTHYAGRGAVSSLGTVAVLIDNIEKSLGSG